EVIESMGSEIYAYFSYEGGEVSSDELVELARDSGITETPGGAGGAGQAVARLNPESDVREGATAKLWFDGAKLHLFDPKDGSSLKLAKGKRQAAAQATRVAVEAEEPEHPAPAAPTDGTTAPE
ncbi:MAG TPA: hypothetical protein VNT54_02870, partial [Solirubrobacteraceae bacterium]|nr:hypothetical protein [Solirubrobacteraceae bacterium]